MREEDFLPGGCEREGLCFARFLGICMCVGALRSSVSSCSSHLDRFLAALYEPWLLRPADIAIVKSSSSTIVFKSRDYIQKWHRTERGQDLRNISAKHLTPCNRPSDETRHSFEEHEIEDNIGGQEGANGTSSEAEVTVCTQKSNGIWRKILVRPEQQNVEAGR